MATEVKTIGGRSYLYEVRYAWDRKKGRSRKQTLRYLGPCDARGRLLRRPRVAMEEIARVEPVGVLAGFYAQAVDLSVVEVAEEALGLSPRGARLLLALGLDALTGPRPPGILEEWIARGPISWWEPSLRGAAVAPLLEELRDRLRPPGHERAAPLPRAAFEERLYHAATSRGMVAEPLGAYAEVASTPLHLPPRALEPAQGRGGGGGEVPGFGVLLSRDSLLPISVRPALADHGPVGPADHAVQELSSEGHRGVALIDLPTSDVPSTLGRVLHAGLHYIGEVRAPSDEVWALSGRQVGALAGGRRTAVRGPNGEALDAYDLERPLFGHRLRIGVLEDPAWRERERKEREALLAEWSRSISDRRRAELARELGGLLAPARGRRGGRLDPARVDEAAEHEGRWVVFSTDLTMDVPTILRWLGRQEVLRRTFGAPSPALEPWAPRFGRSGLWELRAVLGSLSYLLWSWAERRLEAEGIDEGLATLLDVLGPVSAVGWARKEGGTEWTTPLHPGQEGPLRALGALAHLPGR